MRQTRDDDCVRLDAAEWLARLHATRDDAAQQRAFLDWLDADARHRRAYADAEALWEALRDLDLVAHRQVEQARAAVHRHRWHLVRRRLATTAAFAVIGVAGLWLIARDDATLQADYHTALGQRLSVELKDGSRLELNTDTHVIVEFTRHARQLRLLHGQAVFTVAADRDRPFDVLADGARVRDISTQFEVRRWPDRTTVAVLDGAVEVSVPAGSGPAPVTARLERGQGIGIDSAGRMGPPWAMDTATSASWREGRYTFQDQALREVLQELARYHGGSITIGNASLLDRRLSGTIPTDDLALALNTIATALPARLKQVGAQGWQLDPR